MANPVEGTAEKRVSTTYKHLPHDVKPGERILLDDGLGVLKHNGIVDSGDIAVVIFGTTLMPGATDIMKVHRF